MRIWAGSVPAVLATLFLSLAADAQPSRDYMTVLGLSLGQPVAVPKCPAKTVVNHEVCFRQTDFEKDRTKPGEPSYLTVWLPLNEAHPVILGDVIGAFVIDDALEGVAFDTAGGRDTDAQLAIIRTLSAKYGKPSAQHKDLLQNAFGVKIYGYTANWRPPGLSVTFEGASEINRGHLTIATDKLTAVQNALEREAQKRQRKF